MSETIRLVLTGNFLPGAIPENATQSLANLLKLDYERTAHLLANAPTVLKKELPKSQLDPYLVMMRKVGVEVRAEAIQVVAPPAVKALTPQSVAPSAPTHPTPAAAATTLATLQMQEIETITCPSCARQQPKRTLCLGCGCDMPRVLAAQTLAVQQDSTIAAATASPALASPRKAKPIETESIEYDTPRFWSISTTGRLGRIRYLAASVMALSPLFLLAVISPLLFSTNKSINTPAMILLLSLSIWTMWQSFRIMILRLHDLNKPGTWAIGFLLGSMVIGAINGVVGAKPISSILMILAGSALAFFPGDASENNYGAPSEPPQTWHLMVAVVALLLMVFTLPSVMNNQTANQNKMIEMNKQADSEGEEIRQSDKQPAPRDPCQPVTEAELDAATENAKAQMTELGLTVADPIAMKERIRVKILEKQTDCPR